MVLRGSNINVGKLPSHLLYVIFLGWVCSSNPTIVVSEQLLSYPFRPKHSGEHKEPCNNRHKNQGRQGT